MARFNWKSNILDDDKREKRNELDIACKQAILGRFIAEVNGVTYSFSNDTEAQSNFADAKASWMDGDLLPEDSLPWTAYDTDGNVVRLLLNKAQFDPVNRARMQWKLNNIAKFRDIRMPLVDGATSRAELDDIIW